jgi:DNA-binding LacI/PurR family transcriptional regulator
MLRGFSEKLQARDYQVMLLTQWPDGSVDAAVRLLMRYRVDGIVLVSCEPSADTAHDCERAGVRLLLVNREAPQLPATSVVADNARVGHAVAEMFLRAGYERFALVCGDGAAPSIRQRVKSFRAAIAAAKRGRVVIDKRGVLGYQAGRRWVREAMRREPRPDAVFCSSDLTALGVLDGARLDLGIAVPDSLAVVGFGDSPMAAFAAYDLTTAHLPVDSLIDASIESLFAEAPPGPRSPIVIETALVQRATVRKVPSPPRR